MRKTILVILAGFPALLYAQSGSLTESAFWREKPGIEKVKAEIAKGINPTTVSANGLDAAALAINASADNEVIKFLLSQQGIDVNKPFSAGRTYMFWAANRGNTDIMEYLISKGAKVTVYDEFGYSPFTLAAATGQANTKVYDLCISGGIVPKKEIARGGTNALLLIAPYDKDFKLIEYFISKGIDIKSKDSVGSTAFDYAVRSGSIDVLKKLVEKGVTFSPNIMYTASVGGRGTTTPTLELFQYLESLKADPRGVSANGDNALHIVVRRAKQEEIIKYFISKGVDINQANADGTTPFMNAAYLNADTATLAFLMPYVTDINQVNKKGNSALSMAVRRNSPDIVTMLLNKGADTKVVDAEGYNLTFYLVHSYNVQRPEAFEGKLKLLQAKGLDVTVPQKNGNTLYHMVLYRNGLPLLKRIEAFKVDVNLKNAEGLTALHKAALTAKDDNILKYLLSIGAKKEVQTDFSETAFDLAKENEFLTKNKVSIDFLK
ncbi:ankyrin repeat domain-containing protein [Terrimonas sp. NA20]|uniref:Ankyrin repeat domain-containing protein n=1 Tax=Terrimonas ginsenosidimutans TaxID=2908004 RepID=A0ABS9KM43_9BACT|nr:ankyrin repeat domain-containing protein [Terrimonas ginsenosidimutans]MCG2613384.1 ankyrin repeat domain-containing protein [Terrimonas ginsenosidimutans]